VIRRPFLSALASLSALLVAPASPQTPKVPVVGVLVPQVESVFEIPSRSRRQLGSLGKPSARTNPRFNCHAPLAKAFLIALSVFACRLRERKRGTPSVSP
jgi:hypothetical protein